MGISTNAMLVFGFPCGEEGESPEWMGEHEEFSSWLAEKLGLPEEDYKAHFEAEKACPAELVIHCSYDYPMHVLAIQGLGKTAHRGYPQDVHPDDLRISPDAIAVFRDWCEKYGIEYQDPKWTLCSLMS